MIKKTGVIAGHEQMCGEEQELILFKETLDTCPVLV
jgi:hypothetical protein